MSRATQRLEVTAPSPHEIVMRRSFAAPRHLVFDALTRPDLLGRWRSEESGQPIDAKGQLPDGTKFDGPQELKQVLLSRKDEFLRHLARRGLPVPPERLDRDFSAPYEAHPGVVAVFRTVYGDPDRWWDGYEMAEKLVDVEERFQLWRFRHMKTVERIIGYKRGTGGSSGVGFLRAALDLTFFPELLDVRTEIGP